MTSLSSDTFIFLKHSKPHHPARAGLAVTCSLPTANLQLFITYPDTIFSTKTTSCAELPACSSTSTLPAARWTFDSWHACITSVPTPAQKCSLVTWQQ